MQVLEHKDRGLFSLSAAFKALSRSKVGCSFSFGHLVLSFGISLIDTPVKTGEIKKLMKKVKNKVAIEVSKSSLKRKVEKFLRRNVVFQSTHLGQKYFYFKEKWQEKS